MGSACETGIGAPRSRPSGVDADGKPAKYTRVVGAAYETQGPTVQHAVQGCGLPGRPPQPPKRPVSASAARGGGDASGKKARPDSELTCGKCGTVGHKIEGCKSESFCGIRRSWPYSLRKRAEKLRRDNNVRIVYIDDRPVQESSSAAGSASTDGQQTRD